MKGSVLKLVDVFETNHDEEAQNAMNDFIEKGFLVFVEENDFSYDYDTWRIIAYKKTKIRKLESAANAGCD